MVQPAPMIDYSRVYLAVSDSKSGPRVGVPIFASCEDLVNHWAPHSLYRDLATNDRRLSGSHST